MRGGCLDVPMKDSRVCWALGLREELELVMKRQENGKEEKWAVIWRSGHRKRRNDRIKGGWVHFALHYKLAPKDVLAFTILTPSLVSVLIVNRHHLSSPSPLPLSKTPRTVQAETNLRQLSVEEAPLQLSNRSFAPLQCTVCQISEKDLWYVKVEPDHLHGELLLLDIPLKFAKQMAKAYWGTRRGQHSPARPTQKLVVNHHEIEEGDLCIFELNCTFNGTYHPSSTLIHVYVYKKDRGKPSIITITLTKA